MKELKSYKEEQNAVIYLNGKKTDFKVEVEVVDFPLGDLINLYLKLKKSKWYWFPFGDSFYNKYAIEDIEGALNQMKIHIDYKYIKKVMK
jgi:hypothetical protein